MSVLMMTKRKGKVSFLEGKTMPRRARGKLTEAEPKGRKRRTFL